MAQELDIFQDTVAAENLFADSTMQAEQSASECPEGFSYNEELDACVADDFKIDPGLISEQNPYGIDLSALYENRPPPVIQGEDGQMYRNYSYLTANGWITEPDYDTPVYFFYQPLELGDPRAIYYTLDEDGRLESQFGSWRTEEEIRGYWDAEEGMGYFKEANPDLDFDTWFSFIKEASALSASGLNRNDNPEEFDALVNKYGITTFFQNPDGDIFEWNGSSFTKTYKVDDSFPIGDIIMSVAIGYMTAGVLGPGGAFGSSGLFGGGAAGGAASGAIGSTISQGIINGKIDPTAVVTAGVLGGLGGWFDEMRAATPGQYGGWVVDGTQVGAGSQWMIEKTQYLSNLLGIPFNEASGIIEGVLTGTITGEDLEGIAINAVGGWSEAKIKGFLTNTFGEGVDVDNWFREGDSFIPTEAFFPFVETAIQGAIDGGVSKVDLLKMLGGYFQAGGDLDFILPGLPDLDLESAFPDLGFDFCEQYPDFPGLCKDIDVDGIDIDLDEFGCTVDEEFNTELGKCIPKVDITVDEFGCTVDEEFNTELGKCVPKGDITVPEITCPDGQEYNTELGECVDIKVPEINCPAGQEYNTELGKCVDIEVPKVGSLEALCSEPRPEEYGYAQINWDKYCKVPEINCPEGKEYNTELGECVDIKVPKTTCPEGFRDENGECVKIEGPDIDVNIDVPSVSLPSGDSSTGMFSPTEVRGFSYERQTPVAITQAQPVNAMGELNQFISRQLQKRSKGMFT